jgi:hypothetical protein
VTETAERQHLEALWDAELRRIGRSAVIAELGGMSANPRVTFPLYLPNGKGDPKRGCVEQWLGRMGAAEKATEAKRHHYGLTVAVLGVVVAIVMWWFR